MATEILIYLYRLVLNCIFTKKQLCMIPEDNRRMLIKFPGKMFSCNSASVAYSEGKEAAFCYTSDRAYT